MSAKYAFAPDYVVPPGETLRETLEAKGLSQSDLALRTGMAEKTISQIINGIAPISYETAGKFELVTGVPASFWNRMELDYRGGLARRAELQKLEADIAWLDEVPVGVLVEREFVEKSRDKAAMVRNVLAFFGVSSVAAWRIAWANPCAQYRGRDGQKKHAGFVAAWLRMGEIQAEAIEAQPFVAREFQRLLGRIRQSMTRPAKELLLSEMPTWCASAGVCFVLTREIPHASIRGVSRWLTKDRALIQLSLKYKTDDQIWFSFFHEAAHVLLHGKKQVFVDDGMDNGTTEEQEANAFARDILIPPEHKDALPHLKSRKDVVRFAASIGVPPGVVVGRLQHDRLIARNACHDLKVKFAWE